MGIRKQNVWGVSDHPIQILRQETTLGSTRAVSPTRSHGHALS